MLLQEFFLRQRILFLWRDDNAKVHSKAYWLYGFNTIYNNNNNLYAYAYNAW